ncbi:YheT family hydrolase [Symmachiella dynata]|uniref:YheT family hydrolase n=1 Tax=Symmachiella dynata TaxID=2527995 RepID=UPI0030EDE98B
MPTLIIPEFIPHPVLKGGHAQTLAGTYLPGSKFVYSAIQHRLDLPDGDALILHDDQPETWNNGDRVVLMMHGLAGCYESPYMIRIAGKLNTAGARVFRMDHRDCGAGAGLAVQPYNAGRSDDALAALKEVIRLCPNSPVAIVGFSLSANIVLKLLGEDPSILPPELDRGMAVNPPIDLLHSVKALDLPLGRLYDRHFMGLLIAQVMQRNLRLDGKHFEFPRKPRRLMEFDDWYTAPLSGYGNATNYYARCSASQFIPNIGLKTLVITSGDDPLVPADQFENVKLPPSVQLHIARSGGHMGYMSKNGNDPDRRWLDWRVVDWVMH